MNSLISSSCFPNLDPTILDSIRPVPVINNKSVSTPSTRTILTHSVNTDVSNYSEIYPFVKSQNDTLKNTNYVCPQEVPKCLGYSKNDNLYGYCT